MKFTIAIEIECGETTCTNENGDHCPMLRVDMLSHAYCQLFGSGYMERNQDGDWPRYPECINSSEDCQEQ